MIPILPIEKVQLIAATKCSSWLHEPFIVTAMARAPSNNLLGVAPPSISRDKVDLHGQNQMHIVFRSYENRLHLDIGSAFR